MKLDAKLANMVPDTVYEIANLIGLENTLLLIEKFGGVYLEIPKKLNSMRAKWLIDTVGTQATKVLLKNYGGGFVYIPKCHALLTELRNRQFCEMVHQLMSQGISQTVAVQTTAPEFGFSERWGVELLYRYAKNIDDEQLTFDLQH